MIKKIKSIWFRIKLKFYLRVIKAEMIVKASKGVIVPDGYVWKRLSEMLNKGKDKKLDMETVFKHSEYWN